jgi:HEAT repeat protein
MIRDNDLLIRTEAVRCLGRVGRPEDATVLMQIMTLDNNPDCQIAAIEALGTLKLVDPRTPGYLVKAMENDDPAIRLASYQSLKKITGKDLGVEVKVWREFLAKKEAADSRELANLPQLPGATVTLPQLPGASDTLPQLPGASSSGPRGRQAVQNPVLDASARPASSVYR